MCPDPAGPPCANVSAPTRCGDFIARVAARRMLKGFRSLTDVKTVVEIGPGAGAFARVCKEEGVAYRGVDANPRCVQAMRARGFAMEEAMVPPVPLPDALADAIHASHVIEHLADFDVAARCVAEMARVVRPGGVVSIISPDADRWGALFTRCDPSHRFRTTREGLVRLFAAAGLEPSRCVRCSGPLTSAGAAFLSRLALRVPADGLDRLLSRANGPKRFMSLKTTFLGSVWILGRKR